MRTILGDFSKLPFAPRKSAIGLSGMGDFSMPTMPSVSDVAQWGRDNWNGLINDFNNACQSAQQMMSDLQFISTNSQDSSVQNQASSAYSDLQGIQDTINSGLNYVNQIKAWVNTNLGFSLGIVPVVAVAAIIGAVIAVISATYIITSKINSYNDFVVQQKTALIQQGYTPAQVNTLDTGGTSIGTNISDTVKWVVIGALAYIAYKELSKRGMF